jgi:serine/threonine protein phosphatase PrpC
MSGKKASSLLGVSSPYLDASVALDDLEVRVFRLNRGDRVALMSDGVPDFLGGDWLRRLRRLAGGSRSATEFVTSTVEAACAGGAGDNVAIGSLTPIW